MSSEFVVDYVWVSYTEDGWTIRSKTRVLPTQTITNWNYDGSSTGELHVSDSEMTLVTRQWFHHPFRENGSIVLCDTRHSKYGDSCGLMLDKELAPHDKLEILCAFEQEYFLENGKKAVGDNYCSHRDYSRRVVAEEHLQACIKAGLIMSGYNAEVPMGQWEFQVGPADIRYIGNHLWVARYIMDLVASKHGFTVNYSPKPDKYINGSGCHLNFSTPQTMEEGGLAVLMAIIEQMELHHSEDIGLTGKNNDTRLVGTHETSSYHKFTSGVGDRTASVRIPSDTYLNGKGYIEDRRPAANCDPFDVLLYTLHRVCSVVEQ